MPIFNSIRSMNDHPLLHGDASTGEQRESKTADVERAQLIVDSIDIAKRERLIRRVDLQIIPTIMLLYCFSFLDRVNIGNARLLGIVQDLELTGNRYQICVALFFVTYSLCEVPSNLIIKRLRPNRYLPSIAVAWGIVATCMGAVQSYHGLIVARLVLGIVESGLLPGLLVYLTMFYTRRQLALRIAYLFIASAISGVVGGMIAYGVTFLDHHHGLRAWRYLMFIEGSPTIVLGIATYFILPESPEKAHFLSPDDRALLVAMRETEVGQTTRSREFHWRDVREALKDWQVWYLSVGSFGGGIMVYGFSTFMPTIIHDMGGWNIAQANALTVPVYFLGVCVYLVMAWWSDRHQKRGVPSGLFMLIAVAGVGMLLAHKGSAVSYAGLFVVATGMYTAAGLGLSWLPSNKPRWAKRAVQVALHGGFSNFAGIAMPFLFQTKDAPKFTKGYSVLIGLGLLMSFVNITMAMYYQWVNQQRAQGKQDFKIAGKTEEEIELMGDDSPRYVYTL